MKSILFVFDSGIKMKKNLKLPITSGDSIYLFPLTSKISVTGAILEKIKSLNAVCVTIPTGNAVNSAAERIRERYIRFIAEITNQVKCDNRNLREIFAVDRYASLWWLGLVSEKNTIKSDVFNILAQLDSIVETIKNKKIRKVIFGCDNEKLKSVLREYASKNSMAFKVLPVKKEKDIKKRFRKSQRLFYLRHILSLLNTALKFFFRAKKIKRKLKGLHLPPPGRREFATITYYPNIDVSLARKDIFKNRYYNKLQEALENEKKNIVWVALYAENNSISFKESLEYLEQFVKAGYDIFFLEEFNSINAGIKNLLYMLRSGLKFIRLEENIRREHVFDGYNFYSLLRNDWFASFVGSVGYSGLLFYSMFKAFFNKIKAEKCLYFCEMHAWEKALIYARDAVGSKTALFGYQHSTVSKMLLNYFNKPDEIRKLQNYMFPQPDRIICDGPLPLRYLKESGWPEDKLTIAEAVRYDHLRKQICKSREKKKNTVLLALSISTEESSSILNITYQALNQLKEMEVWIRPHPFASVEDIFKTSGISKKNLTFSIRNEPIEKLLSEAHIVIVGFSGVSVEAVAFGCRIVTVNVPEWINMSALKDIKSEIVKTAGSPAELREIVIKITKEKYDFQMIKSESKKIIDAFFYLDRKSDVPERFIELLK
ncbi:MAG: hypothetical protein JSV93_05545 [Candidatus Omnitrophota bacterium]|nr:MAG: hypothetical protein JSV93_05545 [Candidatus Omnitrophota bacterium]